MSDPQPPSEVEQAPALPGPPPPLPDLAAVSASIDPPAAAPAGAPSAAPAAPAATAPAATAPPATAPSAPAPPASPPAAAMPIATAPSAAAAAPAAPPVPPIDVLAVPSSARLTERGSSDVVPAVTHVPGATASSEAGYGRLPAVPVATTLQGPVEGEATDLESVEPRQQRAVAGPWALALAVVALAASFFVGWMLPLGLVAIVVGIVALRRPVESRAIATWAIVLAALSVIYSAGWLVWAASQLGLLG